MPRNYYCDFCQCTFPDNVVNRRNHNGGTSHVNNRKYHYDWFKEPSVFIQEQMDKPPCRHFQRSQGYCEFGLFCKYSHITLDPNTGQPIYPPELIQWFQLKQQEANSQIIKKEPKKTRYRLPAGWKVKELPPSLKPPPSKHGYDWSNVGTW
ncbi:uncharacterized protein EV154DRAFT_563413 [Mucor mucedo]|uniref:uncharacterized protein n=1 Tax=Mucor mucedo TaxID=29922 RepID=UPI002220BF4D|nr:uncharacterized protein EV154DRAFT_563413 [Mucor mucedo]KAI7891275.1 hypothetical protein EV154DRAFT_563413 [Mucor mucedo]